jgi:prepilin-type N-terminal cleavage/methylation domain-containing protein
VQEYRALKGHDAGSSIQIKGALGMSRKKRMNNKKRIGNKGFTILEAVIALAIFSIGILAVAGMQVSSTNGNASARFSTEAATLAQDVVERLLALDYDPDLAIPLPEFDPAIDHSRTDPTGKYTTDWTVSAGPIPNSLTIDVVVSWRVYGSPRRYDLSFIKSAEI